MCRIMATVLMLYHHIVIFGNNRRGIKRFRCHKTWRRRRRNWEFSKISLKISKQQQQTENDLEEGNNNNRFLQVKFLVVYAKCS